MELPPTDHVARVLLKLGARDQAVRFLHAAVVRDPGERACAALLRAVEARPDASVYGPDLALDLGIVRTYGRRGWFVEALAVLQGLRLDRSPDGAELAIVLGELLTPPPSQTEPWLHEVHSQLVRGGATIALSTLDRHASSQTLPAWGARTRQLLGSLLLEGAEAAPVSRSYRGITKAGAILEGELEKRDVKAAYRALRAYCAQQPQDHDATAVSVALGRLVDAMAAMSAEMGTQVFRTQPMTGHNVALFQLRMCNFDVAERQFRKLVLDDPHDSVARAWLDDVQVVRRALGETPADDDIPLRASRPASKVAVASAVGPTPAAGARRIDPLKATFESRPPRAAAALPVVETRVSDAPLEEEPTRKVDSREIEAQRIAATRDPVVRPVMGPAAPSPRRGSAPGFASPLDRPPPRQEAPSLAQALDEDTRQVQRQLPKGQKPVTSPELLKKTTGRNITGWASPATPDDWEESATEIGEPSEMAELLLKQGYAERAAAIYERLAQVYPQREQYASRLQEIRHMIATDQVPSLSGVGVVGHVEVSPPEPELELLIEVDDDRPITRVQEPDAAELVSSGPPEDIPPTMRLSAVAALAFGGGDGVEAADVTLAEGPRSLDELAPPLDGADAAEDEALSWDEEETTIISEDSPLHPDEEEIEAVVRPAVASVARPAVARPAPARPADASSVVAVHRIIRIE